MNSSTSLYCHHDNELRQESIDKDMLCLIETSVDKDKEIVLLAKIKNKGDHDDDCHTGRFWIEFFDIKGFVYPAENLETRVVGDIKQVRMCNNNCINLIDALRAFHHCTGSVSVIFHPTCDHSEWFPRMKNEGGGMKKLPAMFRSNGIGYMKVGDGLNNNGISFFSLQQDSAFLDEEDIFASEAEHLLDENEKEFEEQNTKPYDPFDLLNDKDIDMFKKFCDHMADRGYFDDCEQGSDEYDEKYQVLLAKFTERVLNEREKSKK
eukprot:g2685.t1